ncbi:MAG: hypothetical protein METHP_01472 [Methanoregula sp. SKADARSKE-2]|nr:MAG: hypothetical protein METHP_01472 [Methanoregula sp. SKADARSKE-2]
MGQMGSQHPFCFLVIDLSHLGNINNGFNESAGRAFGGNRASAEKIALFKDKIRGDNVLVLHHLVQISLALSYHVIQRGLLDLGHMMVDHDIGHRVPRGISRRIGFDNGIPVFIADHPEPISTGENIVIFLFGGICHTLVVTDN